MSPEVEPEIVECCETCKFGNKMKNEEKWVCRRYPPQTNSTSTKGITPYTRKDSWCGEFRKKK
jgi:hypothetical protein